MNMYIFLFCVGVFILVAYLSWASGLVTYNKVAGKKVCCGNAKLTVQTREPLVDPVTGDFNWRSTVATNDQDYFIGIHPDKATSSEVDSFQKGPKTANEILTILTAPSSPPIFIETLPPNIMSQDLQKAYDAFWLSDLQKETPEEIALAKRMETHNPADFCGPDPRDTAPKPKRVRKPRVPKPEPEPILGTKPEQPKRRSGGHRGTGAK